MGASRLKSLVGSVAIAAAAAAPPAVAAVSPFAPDPESPLSSRLQQLARDDLSSAPAPEQAEAIGLPARGAGSLLRAREGILVEVRVAGRTRERVAPLADAGADVVEVSPEYRVITAAVAEDDLRALAAGPGVVAITEVQTPITSGADDDATSAINTCTGSVVSEGDGQLRTAIARAQYNVDGAGVEVGVLSDSFNARGGAASGVATADLPGPGNPCGRTTPVLVLEDRQLCEPPAGNVCSDEGRAMVELVHDLAPGADLVFATAFGGEFGMAANIEAMAQAGADVIVDDVTYFAEPMFQDGPIAVAVDHVTAQGVAYYSSAGNTNATSEANRIASWETPSFRDGGACPAGVPGASCLDFDPGPGVDTAFHIAVKAGRTVNLDLQWAEPRGGVATNLDVYAQEGGAITDSSTNVNSTTQLPFEFVNLANSTGVTKTFNVSINRASAAGTPRVKFVLFGGPTRIESTEYQTGVGGDVVGPTIFGHNGAANATSTAAVPYTDGAAVEPFSSRGPVTLYFDSVEAGFPAPPLPAPQVLAKPDISATDGGQTTFFGNSFPGGIFRFFGTSAAAPHAAAVAALQLDANPAQSVAQVRTAQTSTAQPVGGFDPTAAGAGLVDALGAVAANPPGPPGVTVPQLVTRDRTPEISFIVSGDAKTVACALDGGAPRPCDSPFIPTSDLADGQHTLTVSATDYFGQAGSGSGTIEVDTTKPKVKLKRKPGKRTRKRKARFKLSSEPGASLTCALDRKQPKGCGGKVKYRVGVGKHRFVATATDAAGNVGRTTYKWRVRR